MLKGYINHTILHILVLSLQGDEYIKENQTVHMGSGTVVRCTYCGGSNVARGHNQMGLCMLHF